MKSKILMLTIGIVIGSLVGVFWMNAFWENKRANYSNGVKWIIENPQYADLLQKNYETYMKAAEDVFYKTIELGGESK